MVWKHNNTTVIQVNKAWKADGYQHPANWQIWDDETKAKWSVTWTDDPVKKTFDHRFYHGYKVDADGNETDEFIPRSLTDVEEKDADGNNLKDFDGNNIITLGLVSIWVAKKKAEANTLLHETDWEVCRAAETDGKAVASATTTARKAVRTACAGIEDKINACDTLDKFIALFQPKDNGDPSDMDCFG